MTAKPSETPETDAAEFTHTWMRDGVIVGEQEVVDAGVARSLEKRLRDAEAALAKARGEALEEAALLQWQRTMARFGFDKTGDADAIRALKGTK